jgi:predicted permease
VGTNYFGALGIPIILGRDFGPRDTPAAQKVAIINETMAKFYFGNGNPLGRKMWIEDEERKNEPIEIVGVARDVRDHAVRGPVQRRFYIPIGQAPDSLFAVNFEIRSAGKPAALAEAARKAIAAFDPNVPISRVATVEELVDRSISEDILFTRLSSFFGILGLLLACIGLYGVMAYTVNGRTREIGVRMALGAQRAQVLGMVLREAMKLVVIGIIAGIPLALLVSRVFASMLFGLSPTDPVSMLAVVAVLATIATIAGLVPALRATKIDPMVALRYE